MLAAIILAAGESSRMGRPKALLPDLEGRPFVVRLVRTFAAAGIADIIVVTGTQHAAIAQALTADAPPVTPLIQINPNPSRGQLSSLVTGLDAAEQRGAEGVLVTLVDIPLSSVETVRAVADAWRGSRPPIARPAYEGRHGHPVLFDRSLFQELRDAPLDRGARAVVHAHGADIVTVEVNDAGCVSDIDTPEDYAALIGRQYDH